MKEVITNFVSFCEIIFIACSVLNEQKLGITSEDNFVYDKNWMCIGDKTSAMWTAIRPSAKPKPPFLHIYKL